MSQPPRVHRGGSPAEVILEKVTAQPGLVLQGGGASGAFVPRTGRQLLALLGNHSPVKLFVTATNAATGRVEVPDNRDHARS
jgi:hypothetical protein